MRGKHEKELPKFKVDKFKLSTGLIIADVTDVRPDFNLVDIGK